jgi:hypothetical protein
MFDGSRLAMLQWGRDKTTRFLLEAGPETPREAGVGA